MADITNQHFSYDFKVPVWQQMPNAFEIGTRLGKIQDFKNIKKALDKEAAIENPAYEFEVPDGNAPISNEDRQQMAQAAAPRNIYDDLPPDYYGGGKYGEQPPQTAIPEAAQEQENQEEIYAAPQPQKERQPPRQMPQSADNLMAMLQKQYPNAKEQQLQVIADQSHHLQKVRSNYDIANRSAQLAFEQGNPALYNYFSEQADNYSKTINAISSELRNSGKMLEDNKAATILMESGWYEAAERKDVDGMRNALQRAAVMGMNPTAIKTYRDSIDSIIKDDDEAIRTYQKYQEKYGSIAGIRDEVKSIIAEKGLKEGAPEINRLKGSIFANVTKILAGSNVNDREYNNVLMEILEPNEIKNFNASKDALQNMDRNQVIKEIDSFMANPSSIVSNMGKVTALAAKANLIGLDTTKVQGAIDNMLISKVQNADLEKLMRIVSRIVPQDYNAVREAAAKKRRDEQEDFSIYRNQKKELNF